MLEHILRHNSLPKTIIEGYVKDAKDVKDRVHEISYERHELEKKVTKI